MGINFEVNPDEYHPEVGTILPRLRSCQSANDVLQVTHEEFTRWFGADIAGPAESYRQIASDISDFGRRETALNWIRRFSSCASGSESSLRFPCTSCPAPSSASS